VHEKVGNWSDAVRDIKAAFKDASTEEARFELWKERKRLVAARRANTIWWGFLGFMGDLPWTIAQLPQTLPRALGQLPGTLAQMPNKQRAALVLVVALLVGAYVRPAPASPTLAVAANEGINAVDSPRPAAAGSAAEPPPGGIADAGAPNSPSPDAPAPAAKGNERFSRKRKKERGGRRSNIFSLVSNLFRPGREKGGKAPPPMENAAAP